ncbi:MAG: hypothetical protein ACQGVK_24505 [Myxococcota bacterium]
MHLYFSTVLRNAPTLRGGELVRLDWRTKEVLARTPIAATEPPIDDPNPRGNTRGGRGVALVGDSVAVCSYHTVRLFDRALRPLRDVSHPLMVGLHEVDLTARGTLWVTSTAIDAAIEIDLETGKAVRELWPRELPGIQRSLDVEPLAIDKAADNRVRFLDGDHLRNRHHLHLNAVAEHAGDVYALFNRVGAIANLDRDEVVVRDKGIRRGHNLLIDASGLALVNDTSKRHVYGFDLASGERTFGIDLMELAPVARLARFRDPLRELKLSLHKRGLLSLAPPKPIFVRGLARHRGSLFVGLSPATILEIEEASGRLVDWFTFDRRVHACIHGIAVDPQAGSPHSDTCR